MRGREERAFAQGLLRGALLLYPKGYRNQSASEMAGVYLAATADANRREVLREASDLAGHGVRVRLRLTSDRYAGAVLAAAVPYILGSIAGLSGFMLFQLFAGGMNGHHEYLRIDTEHPRYSAGLVMAYSPVPVLVTAAVLVVAALTGRRFWIRWSAVATVVVAVATIGVVFELRRGDHIYVMTTFPGFELPLMLTAFALMLLAVPTDATSFSGRRAHTVVAALAVAALLELAWVREGFAWSMITVLPVVVAAALVVALAVGMRAPLVPGAVGLACAPWLIQPLTGDLYDYGFSGTQYVLLVWLAIVLIFAAGGIRHRRLSRSPSQ